MIAHQLCDKKAHWEPITSKKFVTETISECMAMSRANQIARITSDFEMDVIKCWIIQWFDCHSYTKLPLPPFSLIRDFGKQNTCENVSKISVNLMCYQHVGSKSTNYSPLAWCREGQKVTLVAVIDGFRLDLSITCKTDGNFGNISAGVLFSKGAYQQKPW